MARAEPCWPRFEPDADRRRAVVRIDGGNGRVAQHRWLLPQTGYASQNEPIVHFGLDRVRAVDALRIDWPSGHSDVFRAVEADRYYVIEEGGTIRPDDRLPAP